MDEESDKRMVWSKKQDTFVDLIGSGSGGWWFDQ